MCLIIIKRKGLYVNMGYRKKIKCEDRKKGKSILAFPSDYVVLDIKTTGFDPCWDEIIEICCNRYINNNLNQTMTTFVNPDKPIPDHITQLTQITGQMVMESPKIKDVLPEINKFIGDSIVLGQCVYYDINFLHDAYIYEFGEGIYSIENDYIDLIRIAHRFLPDLPNYSLAMIAASIGVNISGIYRATFGCDMTHLSYQKCKEIANNNPNKEELLKNKYSKKTKACDIVRNSYQVNEFHPFYDATCVFTGKLEKMIRKKAMQIVVNIGGYCNDTITRETDYLILGDYDYCKTIIDGKSSKYKKAEDLKIKGQDIEIISESVFYDMIHEYQ